VVAVTNARFATFVKATGYVTDAERYGWSFVFHLLVPAALERTIGSAPVEAPWWRPVGGASWRAPDGPGSSVGSRQNHPVVHVSWNDAQAYCAWAGARLPTEAEREYAARGGLERATYAWGDEFMPGGRHQCNIWQGRFPDVNTAEDGWLSTAPVTAYRPNGFGRYKRGGQRAGVVRGLVQHQLAGHGSADRPAGAARRRRAGDARRLLSVSSQLLQPLSRCGPHEEHRRQFCRQRRVSRRARGV
jgi:hypothetical protein